MVTHESFSKTYEGSELDDLSHAKRYISWIISMLNPYVKQCVIEVGAGLG